MSIHCCMDLGTQLAAIAYKGLVPIPALAPVRQACTKVESIKAYGLWASATGACKCAAQCCYCPGAKARGNYTKITKTWRHIALRNAASAIESRCFQKRQTAFDRNACAALLAKPPILLHSHSSFGGPYRFVILARLPAVSLCNGKTMTRRGGPAIDGRRQANWGVNQAIPSATGIMRR